MKPPAPWITKPSARSATTFENLSDQTVFFITHRLSTIRQADMIVMLTKVLWSKEPTTN